jgi:hypothetical protein
MALPTLFGNGPRFVSRMQTSPHVPQAKTRSWFSRSHLTRGSVSLAVAARPRSAAVPAELPRSGLVADGARRGGLLLYKCGNGATGHCMEEKGTPRSPREETSLTHSDRFRRTLVHAPVLLARPAASSYRATECSAQEHEESASRPGCPTSGKAHNLGGIRKRN